jgi:hypothetical protein
LYVKLPPTVTSSTSTATGGAAPSGAQWIETEIPAAGAGSSPLANSNPSDALQMLQGHATNVKKVGTALLGGVPTAEYQADFPVPSNGQKGPLAQYVEMTGQTSVPADVWIDRSDRVRQMAMSVVISHLPSSMSTTPQQAQQAAAQLPISLHMTVDISNYGQPVTVTVPPSSEVRQVPFNQLEQGRL